MSQYINSFLIEPVVRQARRFSRPSTGQSERQNNHNAFAAGATTEGPAEAQPALSASIIGDSVARDTTATSPAYRYESDVEEDNEAGGVLLVEDAGDLQLVEVNSLEPIISARQYTLRNAGNIPGSQPQTHRIRDSVRSDTSSLADSSRSLMSLDVSAADERSQNSLTRSDGANNESGEEPLSLSNRTLPEDDGMGHIRSRIMAIQRTDSSNEVKARLVHDVMTEKHNASQQSFQVQNTAHSPSSLQSSERPFTPSSPKSDFGIGRAISPPTSSSSVGDSPNPFHLTAQDLQPTYYEKPLLGPKESENDKKTTQAGDKSRGLGCAHYKRNIKLQCSACSRWYTCRFCHDAVEDHMLNRRETKNMLCMLCGCAQPAAEECAMCNVRGAWYYCDVCKLWDDDPEPDRGIYHCDDCGICRVGKGLGKDFFHCKRCCVCMAIGIRDTHRCIERSTDCDCPICGEYMFTSLRTVVFMTCGHSIHRRCYEEHIKSSYRCPICSRSIENMEWQFLRLQRAIETQPMPDEFKNTKAFVYCNDCLAKTTVKYHWLGLRCGVCDSYNTAQLSLLTDPAEPSSPETSLSTTSPVDPAVPSRPGSRGRARNRSLPFVQARAANSLPPSTGFFNPFAVSLAFPPLRRPIRSVSPNPTTPFQFSRNASGSSGSDDSMTCSDNEDDEYSDVDFWGWESPRSTSRSPRLMPEQDVAVDESSEEDSEDDEDDDEMMYDDDDDDDDVEGNELDQLELLGHR